MSRAHGAELLRQLRSELVGLDTPVPLITGEQRPYVNLDNAASTPTFRPVIEKVDEFLAYYSNVHRGSGFKSQIASWVYEEARAIVASFVNASLTDEAVIFTKNTTESINKLAREFPFRRDSIVITSMMEHHSNELPWRRFAQVVHVDVNPDGSLRMDDYERKLKRYRSKVSLVAITGASNVSGWITPVHDMARMAHEAGAKILVDAAQLAPHRRIDMKPKGHPEHLDYLAFSAHKMYAPFGVGVLVGDRDMFAECDPDTVGGGTVDIVTVETAYWADLPDREEAGTPDIVGVVALAAAIRLLERLGWETIVGHERQLTEYALERLLKIPAVTIYGANRADQLDQRLGVIAFNVEGYHHSEVAAILSYEGAVGVRSGCFCAHPYMLCLLNVSEEDAEQVRDEILSRDRSRIPGAVRMSFGIYNTRADVDTLCDCLERIARGEVRGAYRADRESGDYEPVNGYTFPFSTYFTLEPRLSSAAPQESTPVARDAI